MPLTQLRRCEWNPEAEREATLADEHPKYHLAVFKLYESPDSEPLHICTYCAKQPHFDTFVKKERIPAFEGKVYMQCVNGHVLTNDNCRLTSSGEIKCRDCANIHAIRARRRIAARAVGATHGNKND